MNGLRMKRQRSLLAAAIVVLLGQGVPVFAQPDRNETLTDFWLQYQRQSTRAPDWLYAFAQRRQSPEASFEQRRLDAELGGLAQALKLSSHDELASAVSTWRKTLQEAPALRSPGRVDIAWLAAHPRHAPSMASLSRIGLCERPAWVEIWSLEGVDRVAWRDGMSSDEVIAAIPQARDRHTSAVLVSPLGGTNNFGIAPWNHEQRPVAPGSRLWLNLPGDMVPGHTTVLRWLNRTMPEALGKRLPSDECTVLWRSGTTNTETPE